MRVETSIRIACLAGLASAILAGQASFSQTASAQDQNELLKTFVSELVEITPGRGRFPAAFEMGSADGSPEERPVHRVELKHDFAIAKYEVPQNLYQAVMDANPSRWQGPRNSVERMTWEEANEFCRRLTKLLRDAQLIEQDQQIRLPSEAEWEYCCRAGTTTAYSFGPSARSETDKDKQASILDNYAWHTGNAAGNDPPVGALKPNPWGLYDMHGYLWEFVADAWHDDYIGAPDDGSAWSADAKAPAHVARGGSWRETYEQIKSSSRFQVPPGFRRDDVGLRCVRSPVASGMAD